MIHRGFGIDVITRRYLSVGKAFAMLLRGLVTITVNLAMSELLRAKLRSLTRSAIAGRFLPVSIRVIEMRLTFSLMASSFRVSDLLGRYPGALATIVAPRKCKAN
jgi:hypothetical protein